MCGYTTAALGHAVALLEARLWELLMQELQDLWTDGRGAGAEAFEVAQVVFVDEWVPYHADEDWGTRRSSEIW